MEGESSRGWTHERRTLLQADRFRVAEVAAEFPRGEVVRAIVRHPGAVCIVPMVDRDHVCLICNRRISVARTLLEIPAGTLEQGEAPERTAVRELEEETGYRAARWTPLRRFYPAPGILDEQMHLYLAEELEFVGAAREAAEDIDNQVVTWDEALRLVDHGEIEDGKTLIGLLTVQRLRSRGFLQ